MSEWLYELLEGVLHGAGVKLPKETKRIVKR
jgi:hypothetical protein